MPETRQEDELERLAQRVGVPRELLEDLAEDLSQTRKIEGFLRWREERALKDLKTQQDPAKLVRFQAVWEGFDAAIKDLRFLLEALTPKEEPNG